MLNSTKFIAGHDAPGFHPEGCRQACRSLGHRHRWRPGPGWEGCSSDRPARCNPGRRGSGTAGWAGGWSSRCPRSPSTRSGWPSSASASRRRWGRTFSERPRSDPRSWCREWRPRWPASRPTSSEVRPSWVFRPPRSRGCKSIWKQIDQEPIWMSKIKAIDQWNTI